MLLPNCRNDPARAALVKLLTELRKLRLDCPPDDFSRRSALDARIDAALDRLNPLPTEGTTP